MDAIFGLAGGQDGLFTVRQAVLAGVSERTLRRWRARGALDDLGGGVLALPGLSMDLRVQSRALALRHPWVILTGPSAAEFLDIELLKGVDSIPWVVADRKVRGHAVVLRHPRHSHLIREDLAVARPRQALLDCLRRLPRSQAQDLAARGLQTGLLTREGLGREVEAITGCHGNGQLRALLDRYSQGSPEESERRFAALMHSVGIRRWRRNVKTVLPGYGPTELDAVFDWCRLVVEVDGWEFHVSRQQFKRDRRKQNALIALGWQVLRFTWEDLIDDPQYVIDQVRAYTG